MVSSSRDVWANEPPERTGCEYLASIRTVTFLVLLAAAAGAGIIATDLVSEVSNGIDGLGLLTWLAL